MLTDAIQKFIVPERIWQVVLVIAAVALAWLLLGWTMGRLRKRFKRPPPAPGGSGWTLEQVRKLHKSGQLTDKQYEDLRDVVLAGLKKKTPRRRSHK